MRETRGVFIDKAKARTLVPGWEMEILLHGDVLDKGGAYILDVKNISDTLAVEGEIEFRCRSRFPGASEAFIKTLERPAGMPCDNYGVPGCQQRGCEIWRQA